jgi:hypothetical protein
MLVIAAPSLWAYWVQDGVRLCTPASSQNFPVGISDGAGGAIFVWETSVGQDIYAQRVSASGAVLWALGGVPVCISADSQIWPFLVSDGAGGVIVTWLDRRSGTFDIYAQRINALGSVQWTANGVAICTESHAQDGARIASDGAGGAIIFWRDARGVDADIYAQRVNASGAAQWTANGLAVCAAGGEQSVHACASDGAGGAIVTWLDYRNALQKVYAQRINGSGSALWAANGIAVCPTGGTQSGITILPDDAGGAILAWHDVRGANRGIYTQRLNASGALQWTSDGVALVVQTTSQTNKTMCSDGANGAIVAWMDLRGGVYDIYAQRINASGATQWTANGLAVCTAGGEQWSPQLAPDGAGGAFIFWGDGRGTTYDVYGQRVNASGTAQWAANGVTVCTAADDQQCSAAVATGDGGAIVGFGDWRNVDYMTGYAQVVNSKGQAGYDAPAIASVADVRHDQGGWVRVTIARSLLDNVNEPDNPVATYNVWRRVDYHALLAAARGSNGPTAPRLDGASLDALSGWPIKEQGGRRFVSSKDLAAAVSMPPGTWELIGSFAACQFSQYLYYASTAADSTPGGIPYAVYCVTAHTTKPSVWFASAADSGYSVDNLAPGMPGGLMASQLATPPGLAMLWSDNTENDLAHYALYRGSSETFVPGPGNRLATPTEARWFDGTWTWHGHYYYKLSALDIHGNESGFTLLRPDDVAGTETPKTPEASYLAQNFPNPFNPMTRIDFGMSAPGTVSLRIYDAAGRLVRALAEGPRPAGRYHEAWDGKDGRGASVSSGVYFYRLDAGSFTQTRKMLLVR